MTSIGTGYDLSASTYSPDGRIFQVCIFVSFCGVSIQCLSGRVREQGSGELWVSFRHI
jgi:hypothetical protein